jgi:TolB-like protein
VAGLALFVALQVSAWRSRLRFHGSMTQTIGSLAVLPLENVSNDPEQDYFADGMTEELTTELAQMSQLKVISHTSVVLYKSTKESLPRIARDLGVDVVVEGSVERSGERVGIRVRLIEGASDRQVWAKSYERDLRDVLQLQREVKPLSAS